MKQNNSQLPLDLTKVANKTYDDLASKSLQSTGNTISTIIDFFHNSILYPLQKYNIYASHKLEKYKEELINRTNEIPKENLTLPRVNIFGQTLEGLKYNLDEQYIKEMFTNILISEMDNRTQNKVLPAYIEIVKQLSLNDANFLKLLHEYGPNIPSIKLQVKIEGNEGYNDIDSYIIYNYHTDKNNKVQYSTSKLNPLVIDTLLMHRLIENTYNTFYANAEKKYNALFDSVKSSYLLNTSISLTYDRGLIRLTEFGKNFVDICLS